VNSREFQDRLVRRARHAGAALPPQLAANLEQYYHLLSTWNRKINLTGMDLSDPSPEALDRLLIEPVVAARHVPKNAEQLIDIGSGGGSPAIPFALAIPGLRLRMVESKTRKSVFLREAVRVLEISGAEVITARFETLLARPELHESHDLLTIRAVRVEAKTLMSLQSFVRPDGQMFLFRRSGGDALNALIPPLEWLATYPLVEPLSSRLIVLHKRPVGRSERAIH
jgi:16S rRNA (guanine(527)-N(7))-methyltransferase RsmG